MNMITIKKNIVNWIEEMYHLKLQLRAERLHIKYVDMN